jgi:hypothetical protein
VKTILLGNRGTIPYATLLLASGTALTLSMPWTSRLSEVMSYPWRPFPLPFFLTYGFLSAWAALDRGADAVPVGRVRLSFLSTAIARVAFAQIRMLPLVCYARVLFPDSRLPIPIAVAYVTAVSLCLSAGAVVLEIHAVRQGWHPAVVRYASFLAMLGLPAALIAAGEPFRSISYLSPAVALVSIVAGTTSPSHLALAFAGARTARPRLPGVEYRVGKR